MEEFTGEIIGVMLSADAHAVAIKLSNGTAVTFDARWPDDVLTAEAADFTPPYWRALGVTD